MSDGASGKESSSFFWVPVTAETVQFVPPFLSEQSVDICTSEFLKFVRSCNCSLCENGINERKVSATAKLFFVKFKIFIGDS